MASVSSALANADAKQPTLLEITFVIARKLLGIDAPPPPPPPPPNVPQSAAAATATSKREAAAERDTAHAHADGDVHVRVHADVPTSPRVNLSGTYHDAGYGTFASLMTGSTMSGRS
jgi:hypothetical protein